MNNRWNMKRIGPYPSGGFVSALNEAELRKFTSLSLGSNFTHFGGNMSASLIPNMIHSPFIHLLL
jgi:hypothetical protein